MSDEPALRGTERTANAVRLTLDALRSQELLPDDTLCVYLSGSVVRGWGNGTSDIDVYVITESPRRREGAHYARVPLDPELLVVEVVHVEDERWDVEYWTDSQVDQMMAKVSPSMLESSDFAGEDISTDERDFLDRLGYGIAILGEEWFSRRQAALQKSGIEPIFTAHALNIADGYTEDALGMLGSGDVESAVIAVKIAFGWIVDALLVSEGELAQNPKWRPQKLLRAAPAALPFERWWEIETMQGFDAEAPERWVRSVLGACQELSLEISVG